VNTATTTTPKTDADVLRLLADRCGFDLAQLEAQPLVASTPKEQAVIIAMRAAGARPFAGALLAVAEFFEAGLLKLEDEMPANVVALPVGGAAARESPADGPYSRVLPFRRPRRARRARRTRRGEV
jgi:hypothetical protein